MKHILGLFIIISLFTGCTENVSAIDCGEIKEVLKKLVFQGGQKGEIKEAQARMYACKRSGAYKN